MNKSEPAPVARLSGSRMTLALGLLAGGGMIWGLTFSIAKLVTEAGADPLGVSLAYAVIGGVMLLPYCLVRYRGIPLDREHLTFYAVAGFLGTALPTAVLFSAAPHVPAGVLAIVTALVPLITYVLALACGIERYRVIRAFGIALGLLAVLMIVVPETSLPAPAMAGWVLLALLAPVAFSGENVYVTLRRPERSDSFVLLCGMQFAGALMLLPVVAATGSWVSLALPWGAVEWWIIGLAFVNTAGYLMYLELIHVAGSVFAAQMGYTVTAAGVVWGIVIFDETHSLWIWAALAVIFVGLAMINPHPPRARS